MLGPPSPLCLGDEVQAAHPHGPPACLTGRPLVPEPPALFSHPLTRPKHRPWMPCRRGSPARRERAAGRTPARPGVCRQITFLRKARSLESVPGNRSSRQKRAELTGAGVKGTCPRPSHSEPRCRTHKAMDTRPRSGSEHGPPGAPETQSSRDTSTGFLPNAEPQAAAPGKSKPPLASPSAPPLRAVARSDPPS